jgi:hypothetical protein
MPRALPLAGDPYGLESKLHPPRVTLPPRFPPPSGSNGDFGRFEPVMVTIDFEFDANNELGRLADRIEALTVTPRILSNLLKRAFAETLIPAIRAAYIKGLPKAVDMHLAKISNIEAGEMGDSSKKWDKVKTTSFSRENPTDEGKALGSIYERMRAAQLRNDPERYAKLQNLLDDKRKEFISSLQRLKGGKQKKSHALSSGLFRARALEVLDLLVNQANMSTTSEGDSVSVGLGNLTALDAIKTPSATEYVLEKGESSSKYNILWRQLEFGTGIGARQYDSNPFAGKHTNSRYQEGLPSGMWYYGKSLDKAGLILAGSSGVHALWDSRQVLNQGRAFAELTLKYMTGVLLGTVSIEE